MSDNQILTILIPPEVREDLTDWLLGIDPELTFTTQVVEYHGAEPSALKTAEQVTGRQGRLRVEVQAGSERLSAMLEKLRGDFPASGWPYWIQDIADRGRL
ncbi:Protein of unknown function [Thiohalospira halophila DSM 15071]|uniref:DUF3240 domain-containing protein n=1 Tax=Thiohalospira halophila DSM 15071 TaxID=1123397 RepID=A0A1I1NHP5_9GAMM|nr:DUF3240 family protein [Thiohalospira halophila]SFC93260.1 Protein of unknown function [Thiohalospira halophila DSM 15071]